jgi:integrase/recombinase XerD
MPENKKLTDFAEENGQQSTEASTNEPATKNESTKSENNSKEEADSSGICECYHEIRKEFEKEFDELNTAPPKCGHCIEYIGKSFRSNALKRSTARTYTGILRHFIEKCHQKGICLKDVDVIDVREYMEYWGEQGRSKSTLTRIRAVISNAISRYESDNKDIPVVSWKISNNIDAKKYAIESGFDRDPLDDEEIKKLLNSLNDFRNQLMILTALELGPRAEALCRIKLSDVNLNEERIELQNTKTGGEYTMPLTDNLVDSIGHWIKHVRSSYCKSENNPYLFVSRYGGRLSTDQFNGNVKGAARDAGIQEEIARLPMSERQKEALGTDKNYRSKKRVDLHVLRHTFSWLLRQNGVSKEARSYALDHSLDVTDRYGVDPEEHINEIRKKFNGVDISDL